MSTGKVHVYKDTARQDGLLVLYGTRGDYREQQCILYFELARREDCECSQHKETVND